LPAGSDFLMSIRINMASPLNLFLFETPIIKFLHILYAGTVALPPNIFISTMGKIVLKLNAKFVIIFLKFIKSILPNQNTSVLTAGLLSTCGKNRNSVSFTNAIMINVLSLFQTAKS